MMARPRAFDPVLTLKKAMMVFWERGYFNTSIDDIVAATGVSRYGLYDIYENKRGLFLAALDHYHETVFEAMLATVDRPGASVRKSGSISIFSSPMPESRREASGA